MGVVIIAQWLGDCITKSSPLLVVKLHNFDWSVTMDLHFYSDLSDGTDQNADQEFLEAQVYNGYDPVNKVCGLFLNKGKESIHTT